MLGDKPGTCAGLISGIPAGTGCATPATRAKGQDKFFEGVVGHKTIFFITVL
jgi:hypothetical protein